MHALRSVRWPHILLLIAFGLYFAIGMWDLRAPGPQYDEVADAVPALELLQGKPTSALSHITLGGREWPLMMLHYIGPTSIYTSAIGLVIFGQTVEGLRLTQVLLGALTLLLLYWLSRLWFNDTTAALAVLLCATSPVFLWWSRAGIHFALPLLPLSLGMLIALTRWHRTNKPTWLVLASLLLGLGLTTKLLFAWLLVPMGLTALIMLGWRGTLRQARALSVVTSLLCVIALMLGLGPFILHNIPNFDSFRFVLENASQSQLYRHNNLDVVNNTLAQVGALLRLMSGDTEHFDAPSGSLLGTITLVAAFIVVCIQIARDFRHSRNGAHWFLVLTLLTTLPLSTFSPTAIGARHLFILLPFAWLLVAVAIIDVNTWLTQRGIQRSLSRGALITLFLTASHVLSNLQVFLYFQSTGGTGLWSSNIYAIAETLARDYADRTLVLLDWGFERNLAFVTNLRVRGHEKFEFASPPSPQFDDVAAVLARDPQNIYLAHAPEQTVFAGHIEALDRAAQKQHKQLVAEKSFPDYFWDVPYAFPNAVLYSIEPVQPNVTISPVLAGRNAQIGNGLVLLGGDVHYDGVRREVAVRLQWQSLADDLPDDVVLMHIVHQNTGEVVIAADTPPVYGAYPFTTWLRGEIVIDPHWVTLPTDLAAGVYQVRVGAYDRTTGQRRAIVDPQNDAAGDSLMLATFSIP